VWQQRLSATSSCATANRSPRDYAQISSYPDPAEMGEKNRAVRVPQPVPPGILLSPLPRGRPTRKLSPRPCFLRIEAFIFSWGRPISRPAFCVVGYLSDSSELSLTVRITSIIVARPIFTSLSRDGQRVRLQVRGSSRGNVAIIGSEANREAWSCLTIMRKYRSRRREGQSPRGFLRQHHRGGTKRHG
jgi:hypothetical protein